jgi:hypothetical protein
LFCCWCAQDIEANHFWESMGFVPLAFRAGSRQKGRVHIFWQRRIRAGDETTPWWFPSQTSSGAIREDRLVFPIPPGVHWRDAMPIVLPEGQKSEVRIQNSEGRKAIAGTRGSGQRKQLPGSSRNPEPGTPNPIQSIASGGLRFAAPVTTVPASKPKREPKPKVKNDPKLVAAARELRDRWLERVNADPSLLASQGKYDVGRLPQPVVVTDAREALLAPMAA